MYIAAVRQKVDGDWRNPGDLVPEAIKWKNRDAYLGSGRIIQATSDEEATYTIARLKGVDMDTVNLAELVGESDTERFTRRNMLPRAATGSGLAPMADGTLREPLSGPVLERVLRQAGVPVESGLHPTVTDAELKAEATAMVEGDESKIQRHVTAFKGGTDARAEAHNAQAEEIEAAIVDATGNPRTVPSVVNDAIEEEKAASIERVPENEQERLRLDQERDEEGRRKAAEDAQLRRVGTEDSAPTPEHRGRRRNGAE